MNREGPRNFESGPSSSSRSDTMDRAREMLIGALDRVIQLATNQGVSGSSQSGSMSTTTAPALPAQSNSDISLQNYQGVRRDDGNGSVGTTIDKHRQLFGYRRATPHSFEPSRATDVTSQACGRSYKGKGKRRSMFSASRPARISRVVFVRKVYIRSANLRQ